MGSPNLSTSSPPIPQLLSHPFLLIWAGVCGLTLPSLLSAPQPLLSLTVFIWFIQCPLAPCLHPGSCMWLNTHHPDHCHFNVMITHPKWTRRTPWSSIQSFPWPWSEKLLVTQQCQITVPFWTPNYLAPWNLLTLSLSFSLTAHDLAYFMEKTGNQKRISSVSHAKSTFLPTTAVSIPSCYNYWTVCAPDLRSIFPHVHSSPLLSLPIFLLILPRILLLQLLPLYVLISLLPLSWLTPIKL